MTNDDCAVEADAVRWWEVPRVNSSKGQEWLRWAFRGLCGVVGIGAVSFCGWVTLAIIERPVTAEVRRLIEAEAPYKADRAYIMGSIQQTIEDRKAFTAAFKDNTSAINALRVEIAGLKAVIENR